MVLAEPIMTHGITSQQQAILYIRHFCFLFVNAHLSQTLKKEYNNTSTPPLGFRGLFCSKFYPLLLLLLLLLCFYFCIVTPFVLYFFCNIHQILNITCFVFIYGILSLDHSTALTVFFSSVTDVFCVWFVLFL